MAYKKDEIMWINEDDEIEISLREVNMKMIWHYPHGPSKTVRRQVRYDRFSVLGEWKKLSRPINHKNSWNIYHLFSEVP